MKNMCKLNMPIIDGMSVCFLFKPSIMKTKQSVEPVIGLEETVLNQLKKILAHPLFLPSEILSRFLSFIVKETLAGREDQIKEYTIAINVLNKPVGFVTSNNCIVRIHAQRLRRALLTYYNKEGCFDDCMISIPKGRYIPAFEKLENNQPFKKTGTSSLYNISKAKKIAFMPFKTYDQEVFRNSFVDNLGEELIKQFSSCSELSVLSFHTTRSLSSEKSKIKNLVSSYQVRYIVAGSSRFEQSKIKVFVELIDAVTESQVWSGVYYQTSGTSNYFKAVDAITSELMSDLCKIGELECNKNHQIVEIHEKINEKPDSMYVDIYNKNPKPVRRLAGN
jgi:TolB-like protein